MRVGGAGEEVGGVGLQALGGLLKRKNSSVASTEWTLIKDVCVCCLERLRLKVLYWAWSCRLSVF